jgi:outer membrane protein
VRTLLIFVVPALALAQTPQVLTMADAEQMALKNHPAIESSSLQAEAEKQRIDEARSARYPFASASVTAVGADDASRMAAGGLNNPVLYSRMATGVNVTQNLLDFGRTSHLIDSSKSAAAAAGERVRATKADVILAVRRAYYNSLRADTVLQVAQATVEARQNVVDQVSELVKADLKSSLDLSFANTNLAEAKLLVSTAQNERRAARANLAQAVGRQDLDNFELAQTPEPKLEPLALSELRQEALQKRPELEAARLELQSRQSFAAAEGALRFPSLALTASAGVVPQRVSEVQSNYGAVGLNVSLPFLNGGLYKARRAEAELRARSMSRHVTDLENRVTRDLTVAWLDVNTASERIGLTQQFVDQATQALELAQTRYDLGLGSIVELSQAQLFKTNAQIQYTTARYDYGIRLTQLEYQAGLLQ